MGSFLALLSYLTFLLSLGHAQPTQSCAWISSRLQCSLRKITIDLQNYTGLSPVQIQATTRATFQCNSQLLFESFVSPGFLSGFPNLLSLSIESCKIRRITGNSFENLRFLENLTISTQNGQWSGSFSLEVHPDGFNGLTALEELNLFQNNIWSIPPSALCPLGSLKRLNLSGNKLSEITSKLHCGPGLTELDLSDNLLRKVSFHQWTKLEKVNLQSNQIFQVDFSSLKELRFLNLSTNQISAVDLSSNHALQVIDLGNNLLEKLTGKEFPSLQNLRELRLSSNKILSLVPDSFKNLISLQILRLDNNFLENYHPLAFSSLKSLRFLDLSRNRLSAPLDQTFFQKLVSLRQLYLDHNQISTIRDNTFEKNGLLKDLGLSRNLLTEVPTAALSLLTVLESLDLGENRIGSGNQSLKGLSRLYGLRLVGNRLTELESGFCAELSSLQVLNVAENFLIKVSPSAFVGCPVKVLRLDGNKLEAWPILRPQLPSLVWLNVSQNSLQKFYYDDLPPLVEWLDLSANQIQAIHGGSKWPVQLRTVDLSYNNLTSLDESNVPPTVERLKVNSNQIHTLEPETLSKKNRLQRIELSGNELQSVSLSAIRIAPNKDFPPAEISLGGNPFLCDCSLEWLTRPGQLARLGQYPQVVDLEAITCQKVTPFGSVRIPLRDMTSAEFLCPYSSHCFALCECCDFEACDCAMTCPENCDCYHDVSWKVNIVQCSNLGFSFVPARIPMDASVIRLDGNFLKEVTSHVFIGKKNVRDLYLNGSQIEVLKNKSFNGLRSLQTLHLEDNFLSVIHDHEFVDTSGLTELYLQNNQIEAISPKAFATLKRLKLLRLDGNQLTQLTFPELQVNRLWISANPWSCSCHQLVPWISARKNKIVDNDMVTCSGDFGLVPIQTACPIPERESIQHSYLGHGVASTSGGNDSTGRTIWTVTLITAVIFVIAIVVMVTVRLQDRCYRRTRSDDKVESTSTFLSEGDEKLFDVCVMHNKEDEDLVTHQVIPGLDRSGTLRVLCHRDVIGNSDMTLSAAGQSKSVVIVLSQSFLELEMCQVSSRLSLQLLIEHGSSKIVFISVPPLNRLRIADLFPNFPVLEFGDNQFWPKLRLFLGLTPVDPSSTPKVNQVPYRNESLRTQFQRNITPYQLQVPYHHHLNTSTLRPTSTYAPPSIAPPSWQTLRPTFAESFRYHQRQRHDNDACQTFNSNEPHPHHPLLPKAICPQVDPSSPQGSTTMTDDSCFGNYSSDDDHVYTTVDSPVPQTPVAAEMRSRTKLKYFV